MNEKSDRMKSLTMFKRKKSKKRTRLKRIMSKIKLQIMTIESELNYADIDIEIINKKITTKRRKTRKRERNWLAQKK